MKLCRVRVADTCKPAIVDRDESLRDISDYIDDITAASLTPDTFLRLAALDLSALPIISGTYAPILADLSRIFCIGLNYSDHAAEANLPIPDQPILFMKACAPSGANDPVILPMGGKKTDWEVELGVVIGRGGQHIAESDALDHVAGYCIVNDISERAFQLEHGGQWIKGKSCDSFAPVGPWLVTKEDVPDPQQLSMSLAVNDTRCQAGHTGNMIFSVAQIIAHLSKYLTLRPGDLISTGTPPGVGMGMTPPRYLIAGDIVTAQIAGLGAQRQLVQSHAN